MPLREGLRLQGKGHPGRNGGPCGDLYIEIGVELSTTFKREGNNVYLKVQINAIDAALGCTITVPTVQGNVEMEINEGTQYGQKYRLRGKGIKDLRTKIYGDQYVIIEVITPTNLTKEEKLSLIYPGTPESEEDYNVYYNCNVVLFYIYFT